MSTPQNKGYRILVVDDEPSVRMAYKMMLKHYGHSAEIVSCGHTALDLLETKQFDLIITDYSMPEMKGSELIAEVRRRISGQRIVMVTAFADDILKPENHNGGADWVLHKPFQVEDLQAAITKVMA